MNKLTNTEAAYIAGMVDGDGWMRIGSSKNKRGYRVFNPIIGIANTDIDMLQWVCIKIGDGKIYNYTPSTIKKHWKQQYRYCIYGKKVGELLKQLYPYLIIKVKRAKLIIEYSNTIVNQPTNVKLSEEIWERRNRILSYLGSSEYE